MVKIDKKNGENRQKMVKIDKKWCYFHYLLPQAMAWVQY